MQTEVIGSRQSIIEDFRPSGTSPITFDIPALVNIMKRSKAWETGELYTMVLFKSPEKQILLTVLHEGTEIISFQSKESVTFQIVEGRIKYSSRKGSEILYKDQVLTLNEKIKYSLTSIEETVFLLTVSNSILQPV